METVVIFIAWMLFIIGCLGLLVFLKLLVSVLLDALGDRQLRQDARHARMSRDERIQQQHQYIYEEIYKPMWEEEQSKYVDFSIDAREVDRDSYQFDAEGNLTRDWENT